MSQKRTEIILAASIAFLVCWLIFTLHTFSKPPQDNSSTEEDSSIVNEGSSSSVSTPSDAGYHDTSDTPSETSPSESAPTEDTHDTIVTTPDPTPSAPSSDSSPSTDTSTNNSTPSYSAPSTPACLHYEYGRCWDEPEMEAYYYGIYDHQFGYYGASLYYDDTCDAICQDILDDAYDEGWYDQY
ncbi:hypothetical protein IKE79_00890 [Candidatus Saccharibacteria bacterium]|nr:hypothetical protein [Candidatus Saccharibacteria bacterium]